MQSSFNPLSSRKVLRTSIPTLKDVQTLVRNVDAQVKPLSAGLSETIRDTQKLVKNADTQVASLGTNLNEAIGDGRKLIRNVDGSVESLKVNLEGTLSTATAALEEAGKLFQDLEASAQRGLSAHVPAHRNLARSGKSSPVPEHPDRLS